MIDQADRYCRGGGEESKYCVRFARLIGDMESDKKFGKLYEWKKEILLAQLLSLETCIEKIEKLNKEGKKVFEDVLTSLYDVQ